MELFYRELGTEGRPLIILHGLFGTSDNWMTVAKQLASWYKIYLPDLRNHGFSPWSEEWNYDVMSRDLLDFVQKHQIVDPVVVGHSMGGKVAMLFACRYYPAKLSKLVVVDIAPRYYPPHHGNILDAFKSLDLKNIQSRKDAEDQLSAYIPAWDTRQFLLKNLHRDAQQKFEWKMNLEVIEKNIETVGEALAENLSFEGPTLFIRGGASDYIQDQDREQISYHFPQARLLTIKSAGHWVHAEKPAEMVEVLKTFAAN